MNDLNHGESRDFTGALIAQTLSQGMVRLAVAAMSAIGFAKDLSDRLFPTFGDRRFRHLE